MTGSGNSGNLSSKTLFKFIFSQNQTEMTRYNIFVMALLFCAMILSASAAESEDSENDRTDANIVGHILDASTGEHVPFMDIIVEGTMIYTMADATGHYFLKDMPEGKHVIRVSGIGYKTARKEVVLEGETTLELNFDLEPDSEALNEVVVSASRSETLRKMSPTLVNVVNAKIFNYANAANLAEGVVFQPGVRVENNCQNCGSQQIRINGLEGPYTQILIDSRPIFSALAGVYGIEQIPAAMIDRVEVVRGGGSALFGASAIAGTVNVITKEPERNTGEISHTSGIIGKGAFESNTNMNASIVTDDNKAGLMVFGQMRNREGYDHDGDGFTEIPELKSYSAGLRSFIRTGTYSRLKLEYHHIYEYRRGGDSLMKPPHDANIAEQVRHDIDAGGLSFDYLSPDGKNKVSAYASVQHINRESYYGINRDPDAYGETGGTTWIAGGQYVRKFDRCFFMPSDFTVGIEATGDYLRDNMWGYHRTVRQDVHTGSVLAQNEWKNEKWSILVGGRLDLHSMMDHPIFSPRANLRFNPTENINLRVGYSSGYRAPQVFDEDLHISNVGGEVLMVRNSKDLKEERSHNVTASVDLYGNFGDWQTNLLVEGFFNRLVGVFELGSPVLENDILYQERSNGPGAFVAGATLEGKASWRKLFSVQMGMTWQQSRYDEPYAWSETADPVTKMLRSPDLYGYITAEVTPYRTLSVALTGTYTGPMLVNHFAGYIPEDIAVVTPDFFDMGLKVSYDFNLYNAFAVQINAGIRNIFNAYQKDFDQGIDRDAGYIYGPSLPRNCFAGIKLMF